MDTVPHVGLLKPSCQNLFVQVESNSLTCFKVMEIVSAGQEKDSAAARETVDIRGLANEARLQASAKLEATLRGMLNNPAFSDVAFLCNDGNRVQGCRIWLAGRSEVLKSMFMNGMAESDLSEIELPEMSSPVLLSVFEFLYTGTLRDYYPQSWKMSCEVINASRFFLLPELDVIVREFIHSQMLYLAEDLPKAATLLTEALEFKALCDPMDVTLRELVKILGSNWSDPTFIKSLSEDAVHYFLANSMGKSEDLDVLSFREYLRFRQVIRWWVYQCDIGSCGIEELVNFLAPDLVRALSICRNQGNLEVDGSPKEDTTSLSNGRNSLQLDKASRDAAIRLLVMIDYRCIHPVILATVVNPLKISSPEVISAFQYQAIRRPMVFKTLEWEHDESYGTVERGHVIHRTGTRSGANGLAVMKVAMSGPGSGLYGLFQWIFIVEEIPDGGLALGFMCSDESKVELRPKLDDLWLLVRQGNREGNQTKINHLEGASKNWKLLQASIKENSGVLFSFNAFEFTCSLSIDGQQFKDIWKNIPSGIYYPVLTLASYFKGRIRIELLSGFDLI